MKNTLNISWYKTVQAKLIIITMVTSTIILAASAIYDYSTTKAAMQQDLERLAQVTAQSLSKHLVTPLWDLDGDQVADSITAAMLEQRVYAVVVRDADGQKIFKAKQRQDESNWTVIDSSGVITGDLLTASADITAGKDRIGVVEAFITPAFMNQELSDAVWEEVMVVALLDAIIFLTLWFVARRILVQPIMELANSAERMSKGQLNVSFDVESDDEIGHLADAFRRLQMSLRLAIRRLKQASTRMAA